jgi:PAS domain-containing protein
MSLDSLLHFISSSGSDHHENADLAFAEVDANGRITSINPFGRLAWGWRVGSQLEGDLLFALDGLGEDNPEELLIMVGGLHLRGMSFGDKEGWFLIGHEPQNGPEAGQQLSFRSLMDRIPMPACSLNTNGLALYTNAAAAGVLGREVASLAGEPVLAELIHPEDRWKLAEIVELAAGEGSSHTTVRFGHSGQSGVLHVVQSVPDEYHAIILPISGELGLPQCRIVPETFYQSFREQGPVGILYLDAQGRVTFENHHFRSIVGLSSADSWLGFPLSAVHILDQEAASDIMAALEDGNPWTGAVALRESEDHPVRSHLQIHAAPIKHPDGHRIGAALMVEDRTDLEQGKRTLAHYELLESVKADLRALSSSYPAPAGFRQKATELLAEAFGADRTFLLGLSIAKERLVEIARTPSASGVDTISIARAPLALAEVQRFGSFIQPTESYGLPLPEGGEIWLDPVHDNEQFAGFMALVWDSGSRMGFRSPYE